ncbi:MAG TPA: oxygen-independent coproporphyrinogen III oxidase [Micropepsaceae bacterium]|nr:oxygen-independent coproporphyrinogen III oxidase [Micropepsaceae bacterium]
MTKIKGAHAILPQKQAMDARLLPYAEKQAPRYTSYPSAPHFGGGVDGARYAQWLGALAPDAALALYIHVPYCKRICWYCGCNTSAEHAGDAEAYAATLLKEIALVSSRTRAKQVAEIHWGGGTPNVLSPQLFDAIMAALGSAFALKPPFSHAIEMDPRSLTRDQIRAYAAAGVNRASLGVQTFSPHVQEMIGRVQPFEQVARAVDELRSAGITAISFDLMYGLPGQTHGDLMETLSRAVTLAPDRVALFGYAHVPWFKSRQRAIAVDELPGAAARFDMAAEAKAFLTAQGYEAIGMDHFAKAGDPMALAARAGTLHRNFQGYVASRTDALIGLGPSAISALPQGYAQNDPAVPGWRRAVDTGVLPIVRGHRLSDDDRLRARIIERLMCDFKIDLADFGGRSAFAAERAALAPLAADGLVVIEGDQLFIPEPMRPFCRLVAQAFDAYTATAQYSRSV